LLDLINAVPLAVVGASILGSSHCVGMCGGLALSRSQSISDQLLYHGGRLFGYVALGVGGGALGAKLFSSNMNVWMSWASSILMAAIFLILAVRAWRGKVPHFSWFPGRWLKRLNGRGGSFSMGLLTAGLPCGWLQTFVLTAVATQSAVKGGLLMLLFWLGTLPALAALPLVARSGFAPFAARTPRLTATLLLLAGLVSFGVRIYHAPYQTTAGSHDVRNSCHR
jgi:sulfite exporter TauE/SafE